MTDIVLVTAASRGIGRGIATRLAKDGYSLVTLDRDLPAALLPRETFIQVDLGDPEATAEALAGIVAKHAPTRLVNNAGTVRPGPLEDVSFEDLQDVVALNLYCSIQCAQAVLPAMKAARFGRIVNISSRAALGKELRTVYSATKAGLHGMTRTWALELAAHGITVNAIGPGPIATELFRRVNPADSPKTKAIIDGVPVKRLGTPEDIAHAALFLMTSRQTTGAVLEVSGGETRVNTLEAR